MVTPPDPAAPRPPEPAYRLRDRAERLGVLVVSLLGPRVQRAFLRRVFDRRHRGGDPWSYEASPYEQGRMRAALDAAGAGPFPRCLEVGCSEGVFTRLLGADPRVGQVTALDVSATAAAAAARRCADLRHVQVGCGDALSSDLGGPHDLIFCMEILYYLGATRGRAARRLVGALAPGGRIVLVHPHPEAAALHRPFALEPRVRVVSRTVAEHPIRPFEVLVLERVHG